MIQQVRAGTFLSQNRNRVVSENEKCCENTRALVLAVRKRKENHSFISIITME